MPADAAILTPQEMCQEIALANISIFKQFHFKDYGDHESKEQRESSSPTP